MHVSTGRGGSGEHQNSFEHDGVPCCQYERFRAPAPARLIKGWRQLRTASWIRSGAKALPPPSRASSPRAPRRCGSPISLESSGELGRLASAGRASRCARSRESPGPVGSRGPAGDSRRPRFEQPLGSLGGASHEQVGSAYQSAKPRCGFAGDTSRALRSAPPASSPAQGATWSTSVYAAASSLRSPSASWRGRVRDLRARRPPRSKPFDGIVPPPATRRRDRSRRGVEAGLEARAAARPPPGQQASGGPALPPSSQGRSASRTEQGRAAFG